MYTIPEINTPLEPLVCWSGAFTPDEIETIIKMGDMLEFSSAKVGGTGNELEDTKYRNSKITWIKPKEENAWLFNKMAELVAKLNNDKFQFNLSHIGDLQYTTYTEGDFYDWHIDAVTKSPLFGPTHRKLGISVLLSDPESEFTGGEFQIIPGGNPTKVDSIPMKKGDIAAFPSFLPHRVSEVNSGKRKSLVVCVLGSKFK